MTLEELELIIELPEYSSFADASFYLPYSTATITKYVNNVEKELGIAIFTRSNKSRTLQLTDKGKKLIESIKRICEDYDYLKQQAQMLNDSERHGLRIGSQPRFGNIHEQKILSRYMLQHPTSEVNVSKQPADGLIRALITGKLDAALITFNKSTQLEQYFGENRPRIKAVWLAEESEMYVGVSEQYFKERKCIILEELEGFTMAFPFPNSNDLPSAHALQDWISITKAHGLTLNYIHSQGYDDTIFQMALARKIAITTNNIPTVRYPGIHFLRIDNWTGGNNLYLVRCNDNKSVPVKDFEAIALEYSASLR